MESRVLGPGRHSALRGRGAECALLDDLVAAVRRCESRSLVLKGEAGIGKTALLEYLIASASDLTVVRAVGVQSDMPIVGDPDGPCFEGPTMMAAMAAQTTRVRVAILVTGVTYRHPAVAANIAATIDHISGGRAEYGVGAAWMEQEHRQYGIPFPRVGVRMDMTTDNAQRSVLLIGKSELVLDEAVARLRDLGHKADATNDFTDISGRFDVKEVDLVVFGGQVPPDRKAELREEIGAINPRVIFVQGLAGIPGLIVNQIQGAFTHHVVSNVFPRSHRLGRHGIPDSRKPRICGAFQCAQGDSNSHGPNGAQGPQPRARGSSGGAREVAV